MRCIVPARRGESRVATPRAPLLVWHRTAIEHMHTWASGARPGALARSGPRRPSNRPMRPIAAASPFRSRSGAGLGRKPVLVRVELPLASAEPGLRAVGLPVDRWDPCAGERVSFLTRVRARPSRAHSPSGGDSEHGRASEPASASNTTRPRFGTAALSERGSRWRRRGRGLERKKLLGRSRRRSPRGLHRGRGAAHRPRSGRARRGPAPLRLAPARRAAPRIVSKWVRVAIAAEGARLRRGSTPVPAAPLEPSRDLPRGPRARACTRL